ncbi:hypothetical protein HMI01_02830 [Halolactibacillus miurensis]|uniref:Uncharacterized protein n=1 Tax=Halolactibacillus miurensis TaxID=306541 RepID=A0A1I6Q4H9_9BACI|nr:MULTISPECIES: hypothetical protein [Halolactibacillus]GEM03295.1 hypothetical protein HMI01_02830 [Halolactibacillus miurensis]SFS47304.1 hypothetical protein SAMN05421668_10389 [Halolactibacillus miurensis]
MKRFLMIAIGVSVLIFIGLYLYFVEGIYVAFLSEGEITTPFYTADQQFFARDKEGDKAFEIKGVELDSSYGPHRGTDFPIEEEKWQDWFDMINDMGANTIRVSTVMNATFYNALYDYNEARDNPLYLIQGIRVSYDEVNGDENSERMRFYSLLKEDARDVIDIIHGRNLIFTNDQRGSGFYRFDVSPYVIGYLIGDEWNQDMISYLDHTLNEDDTRFNGDYIQTVPEATSFEKLMAALVDDMLRYESNKYRTQRPIAVNSTFVMDPFEYPSHIKQQIGKINHFTMDHLLSTDEHLSGLFASYSYEEWPEEALQFIETDSSRVTIHDYLRELNDAHDMPVIMSSFGYPSETYINQDYNQGDQLIEGLTMFQESGFNGTIIRSFQDVWDRRNLTTAFMYDLQSIHEFSDVLTPNQHYGLIGYRPYREDVLMTMDGDEIDWEDVEMVSETNNNTIKVTRDHGYLYILVNSDAIQLNAPLYFGFDLHPGLGTTSINQIDATLTEPIEFFLGILPGQGGVMRVIENYQASRQQFLERVNGVNPYVELPKAPLGFERFKVAERNPKITEENATSYTYPYTFKDVYPLVLNGEGAETDIYLGEDQVELRIPYGLLNMYDPLKPTVHDDYYTHYGVEPVPIDGFHLSMMTSNGVTTDSVWVPLDPLSGDVAVEEVVKPSYERVKSYWGGEDE